MIIPKTTIVYKQITMPIDGYSLNEKMEIIQNEGLRCWEYVETHKIGTGFQDVLIFKRLDNKWGDTIHMGIIRELMYKAIHMSLSDLDDLFQPFDNSKSRTNYIGEDKPQNLSRGLNSIINKLKTWK